MHIQPNRQDSRDERTCRIIEVAFNEGVVELDPGPATGLEIKQAAIDQGIAIELSFLLTLILPSGRDRQISNDDIVKIRPGIEFVAIPCDDNS